MTPQISIKYLLIITCVLTITPSAFTIKNSWGGLYPRESTSREIRQLDGIWDFRIAPRQDPEKGFKEKWHSKPLALSGPVIKMPVPSSYNDITQDKAIRDHIGWAWYDRTFYIPQRWIDDKRRIVLRLGSAHYNSIVYVNGVEVATHEGGYLPIMADISKNVYTDKPNLISISINNTLTPDTIPQGKIIHKSDLKRYPPGYFVQTLNFDYFNFAGIHRPVFIYTTPQTYIEDIDTVTSVSGTTGSVRYNITVKSAMNSLKNVRCSIRVYDRLGNHSVTASGCIGQFKVENANFWWPYLMSENPGYLYTLQIILSDGNKTIDSYPQKIGFRELAWNSTSILINNKPLYLMGCGKHEDASIRGKGVDNALIVKDFNLLKWIGANSFRTSHYPYAEEIMDMADEQGIMVINESPAIGLTGFGKKLENLHISVMQELIARDKNRPSVIMWSLGNEPNSGDVAAANYFKNVAGATKAFDPTRPITCALSASLAMDKAAPSLDVLLVNRYFSWYGDTGHLEVASLQTVTEFSSWYFTYLKPVIISEYGAGSIAGLHTSPSFLWSEEYQVELMLENFKAFDILRDMGFFFGEMIWNFADFATPQETNRPPGCMKGIFTRERQPKMSAAIMRWRYLTLAEKLHNTTKASNATMNNDYNTILPIINSLMLNHKPVDDNLI